MIAKFVLFDMRAFVTPLKRVAPALLLVVVAPTIGPSPAFGIVAAAIVMSLLSSNPFAADERGRLDTLYSTLPLSRRSVVVGRYIALLVLYIVVALLGTVAALVVLLVQHETIDAQLLVTVNAVSISFFAVALAVQLPFFFSVGFTRARLMTFIPGTLLVGGAVLASQLGLFTSVDLSQTISQNLSNLWIAAPIVAAVVIASIAISTVRYGRRAL